MKYKNLNYKSVSLDKIQLEQYLEKLASDHILQDTSSKETYPIPKLKENFSFIEEVYHLLNEHIKLKISIYLELFPLYTLRNGVILVFTQIYKAKKVKKLFALSSNNSAA